MYTILNCVTNNIWTTDSKAEARFYCNLAEHYNVFKNGHSPIPIMSLEV